jgi:peptidoglycan/xylan/chitin deacetylase (PgdA/CDA1 family)
MKHLYIIIFLTFSQYIAYNQPNIYRNTIFLKKLYKDKNYQDLRNSISTKYAHITPGKWGEFVKGVETFLATDEKVVALTFDACGGRGGNKFDSSLINFLRREKIPATLFVTGKWIDANYTVFIELSKDALFEIENHGLNHKPCSVCGDSIYGIKGTTNVLDALDEIEANALKIKEITGRRPLFYRSATAYTDEACVKIAKDLNITIVSFGVLSNDALPNNSAQTIKENVLKNVKPGAIIIMHFNHPERNTYKSLIEIIPELRKQGYGFVKLNKYPPRKTAN